MARIAPAGGTVRSTEAKTIMYVGFKSFSKISNFLGLGCSRKAVARDHQPTPPPNSTIFHLAEFSPTAVKAGPPCSVAESTKKKVPVTAFIGYTRSSWAQYNDVGRGKNVELRGV
jgi:hypothetical protein